MICVFFTCNFCQPIICNRTNSNKLTSSLIETIVLVKRQAHLHLKLFGNKFVLLNTTITPIIPFEAQRIRPMGPFPIDIRKQLDFWLATYQLKIGRKPAIPTLFAIQVRQHLGGLNSPIMTGLLCSPAASQNSHVKSVNISSDSKVSIPHQST